MKNKYYYEFIYEYASFDGRIIVNYLEKISESFIPKNLFNEENRFNNKSLEQIKQQEFKSKALLIKGINDDYLNVYSAHQNRLIPKKSYTIIRFINKQELLGIHELLFFLNLDGFKIGFINEYSYQFIQSTDNPSSYMLQSINYTRLPKYFNENIQMDLIDISKNPGREVFLPGIKFIPAFKIWFGKESQDLFGREKILQYKNAIEIKEFDNGVIEMQLMDDIMNCDTPYNQEKQKDIVKYLGVDKMEVSKY